MRQRLAVPCDLLPDSGQDIAKSYAALPRYAFGLPFIRFELESGQSLAEGLSNYWHGGLLRDFGDIDGFVANVLQA
ncbi:hypothetical protein JNUCC0626_27165 [Lentzea sp. JNUCC 0626]|uniref:hypothetical protein n=1 Tax=Lentzea sp. JNUCC 0626 TaxID=3367513 RepID=UPI003748B4F2